MDISIVVLYIISIGLLILSFFMDKQKTYLAIKKGWLSFKKIIPILIPLFLIVGFVLTLVTPNMIRILLGDESGILGVIAGLLVGSVAFMPPFVTFPLAAELLDQGAGFPQIAAFVTTLMGVGLVYWSAETKYFNTKSTILRNILAFVASGIVACVIWGVM
jgi:uncharacterized membrane protein YraQ (UPF0718 family)